MMKKTSVLISLLLLALSVIPIFLIVREIVVSNYIINNYEITLAEDQYGYPTALDSQITEINGHVIEIDEEPTGKKEVLEQYELDSGEVPREIVVAQIIVDGEKVGEPYEIKLGARSDHTRYHNYLDILSVKENGNERVAIVITKKMFTVGSAGEWDIIWVDGEDIQIESFNMKERSENVLATRLVNYAGLAEMSFGYYSDINHVYPTLFFPLLYPAGTAVVGILLLLYGIISFFCEKGEKK